MTIEQFLFGVPEDLWIWLCERKPNSLRQVVTLADDNALTRWSSQKFHPSKPMSPPTSHVCSQDTYLRGKVVTGHLVVQIQEGVKPG